MIVRVIAENGEIQQITSISEEYPADITAFVSVVDGNDTGKELHIFDIKNCAMYFGRLKFGWQTIEAFVIEVAAANEWAQSATEQYLYELQKIYDNGF